MNKKLYSIKYTEFDTPSCWPYVKYRSTYHGVLVKSEDNSVYGIVELESRTCMPFSEEKQAIVGVYKEEEGKLGFVTNVDGNHSRRNAIAVFNNLPKSNEGIWFYSDNRKNYRKATIEITQLLASFDDEISIRINRYLSEESIKIIKELNLARPPNED